MINYLYERIVFNTTTPPHGGLLYALQFLGMAQLLNQQLQPRIFDDPSSNSLATLSLIFIKTVQLQAEIENQVAYKNMGNCIFSF